jgi:hypothetical protein
LNQVIDVMTGSSEPSAESPDVRLGRRHEAGKGGVIAVLCEEHVSSDLIHVRRG